MGTVRVRRRFTNVDRQLQAVSCVYVRANYDGRIDTTREIMSGTRETMSGTDYEWRL